MQFWLRVKVANEIINILWSALDTVV